jgi:Histidine kinase
MKLTATVAGFAHWLQTHRGAFALAGLLSFAVPVTLFTGAVSVMREPTVEAVTMLGLWYVLYGFELWCLLLVIGYSLQRLNPGTRTLRGALLLLGACAAAGFVEISTTGRAHIVVEQGVARSTEVMHAYAFMSSFIMALLFFAHLQRSHAHEKAAARLAFAQTAQREARRRLVQARLQAVQARIDPELLFDMLDAVRRSYELDASRAERLLDELIAFLRAALPRLRNTSSSVPREAELACAYARLRALAGAYDAGMTLEVSADLMDARFPPGVLLPLLDDALRTRAGPCELAATRLSSQCQVVLTLPARPSDCVAVRVRALLADLYGSSTELTLADASVPVSATIKVPYELA